MIIATRQRLAEEEIIRSLLPEVDTGVLVQALSRGYGFGGVIYLDATACIAVLDAKPLQNWLQIR